MPSFAFKATEVLNVSQEIPSACSTCAKCVVLVGKVDLLPGSTMEEVFQRRQRLRSNMIATVRCDGAVPVCTDPRSQERSPHGIVATPVRHSESTLITENLSGCDYHELMAGEELPREHVGSPSS